MYYRIAFFEIDPQYEIDFIEIADSFRNNIKPSLESPFIDFVKTGDRKAMIVITYEGESSIRATDKKLQRTWFKLQRSKFVKGPIEIVEGIVSWML
jgi:heat shock protein HspQ